MHVGVLEAGTDRSIAPRVDNNLFTKRLGFSTNDVELFRARCDHSVPPRQFRSMKPPRAPTSQPAAESSEGIAPFKMRLTREQHDCLSRCARGISVRFERSDLIDALVAAGYAEKGVAGVVTVTARGREYLQKQSV